MFFKTDDKKNIVVWGDSIARGIVYDEKRGRYAHSPITAVKLVAEKLGLRIANRARLGLTVKEGALAVERDLARGIEADIAILAFGDTDCAFDWQKISHSPEEEHRSLTTAEEYEAEMSQLVETVRDAGIRPILVTLPPIMADRYFDFVTQGELSGENILKWLGDKSQIYRYHERYSTIVSRIAAKYGCKLLDIRSAFLAKWNTNSLFCADGVHPTADGQKFIGEAILATL